jgi:membrane fusion protein (multidrug efflux system)
MAADGHPVQGAIADPERKTAPPPFSEAGGFQRGYREGFQDGAQSKPAEKDDESEKEDDKPKEKKSPLRRALPFVIVGLLLVLLIGGGTYYWLSTRDYESTDDAFIDAHTANVSSQVAGRVTKILFDDNQQVAAGQRLMQIDPRDYQVKLDQANASLGNAEAQLAQARAQLALQQANADQAQAQVRVGEAELQQAQQDLARQRSIDPRATTRQQVDSATAQARTAQARLDANRHAVTGAQAQVDAAAAQVAAMEAQVRGAKVDVANAELQLSYTDITAPVAGRVAKRNVEVGTYATPGQALVAIVPAQVWVTANFKETQLADMKPGDPVDIKLDAYPDTVFHGKVDSFQTGTGSAFSTLPAENATGNYVKVVQRLPVKIVFDDQRVQDMHLAPGLSVVPRVKVR